MADVNETPTPERAEGILFPMDENGRRSTQAAGKQVFAAALRGVDEEAAVAILAEEKWRSEYPQHIYRLVEAGIKRPDAALAIASQGLEALYGRFQFVREETTFSLPEAMATFGEKRFFTAAVHGQGDAPPGDLRIPYGDQMLAGDDLLAQIERWETRGVIEPSHGEALRRVQANPEWLDLSDHTFVLLGAGAEMGPLSPLMQWRANIVAVDVARPAVWQRLITQAREANGVLLFPLRIPPTADMDDEALAAAAGCDLLAETPEIRTWLQTLDGPLTVGSYAYLDGARHVQVSLAMDAIAQALVEARDDVSLAYLLTPTDVYAISKEAAEMAMSRYEEWKTARAWSSPKLWQEPLRVLSGGRFFTPNVHELVTAVDGQQYGISDCLVIQQGPNYALAKRLQQWRATVTREGGVRVSINVAPATTTHSVVKNPALAAAYAGAGRFEIEIFRPETSNAIMAALLVHDLRYDGAAANTAVSLNNPLELFMEGANHNGLWRTGFRARSVLEIAAILGWRAARSA